MENESEPFVRINSDALFESVYEQLKRLASKHRNRAGHPVSICTTEVVHEAFLRMTGSTGPKFEDTLQFFAYSARAMRHVLVDLARKKMNVKDGGGMARVQMDDPAVDRVAVQPLLAIELDSALRALEAESPRAAQVVELHYFAGLTLQRVAELTNSSPRTVDRNWRYARSFLISLFGDAV